MTDVLPPNRETGKPTPRLDARAKVTGEAKYAGEHHVPGLHYGVAINSAIARGRIRTIDVAAAAAVPGVVKVYTHESRPGLSWFNRNYKDEDSPKGTHFAPLYDDEILYSGQPIALVVAETFETARYAATLIRVTYTPAPHETDLRNVLDKAYDPGKGKSGFEPPPPPRGDAAAALRDAPITLQADYYDPPEHHNPMEMHATTAVYHPDGSITLYDKTQGTQNSQAYICGVLNLPKDTVRVLAPYVGGAFGSGLRPQYQIVLATMAAVDLKRPVRVTLTRQQMFTFGHRPETIHNIELGASAAGELLAIKHRAVQETSRFEDYTEVIVNWSGSLYRCPNIELEYRLAQVDVYTPLDMRAPGAAHGVNAFEVAVDELAYKAGMDPLEFRIKNYTDMDMGQGKPFSSKELLACFKHGAATFGWDRRPREPRAMRDGRHLLGWGVAVGAWEAKQAKAAARARITADGQVTVSSAITDIGTGTYTIMAQIAADALGVPLAQVCSTLGDSRLPTAPLQGGSYTTASVGTAVQLACDALKKALVAQAGKMAGSPFAHAGIDAVDFWGGRLRLKADVTKSLPLAEIVRAAGVPAIEAEATSTPPYLKQRGYTRQTHAAYFVEVRVDEDLGTVGVSRVAAAVAAGRIINPKTARSQIMGGIVWGISKALHEETYMDHRLGRFMNHNFAEYHVPVNADIHAIDVEFVEEHDLVASPIGVKGLAELGVVGTAAAVNNAVFHATGKRVREYPLTVDKVM
jgi:xanthine dehydrogenase YagR molybdenum-binding subunit